MHFIKREIERTTFIFIFHIIGERVQYRYVKLSNKFKQMASNTIAKKKIKYSKNEVWEH
jgi:hypothetical protein